MIREEMIDEAVATVFRNENMLAAWRRLRMVTPSMADQVRAQFRNIDLRERSGVPV